MSANSRIVSIVEDEPSTAQLFDDALRAIKGIKVLKFIDPIMLIIDDILMSYFFERI